MSVMRFPLPILILFTLSAAAQPRLKSELSRNMVGEFYSIQYTIEGAAKVTSFTPPDFHDLKQLRAVEQTHGYSLVNGELEPYVNFIYQVTPKKAGRIAVGDAVAVADGKTLKGGALEIYTPGKPITADAAPGELDGYLLRKGERAEDKMRGNLFVKLVLSRDKCYVGEAVVAEYRLYTRLNSESRVVKRPSFNGFSVFDMLPQESGAVQRETINGRSYDVYPLRKVLMYPLQSGTLTLEPLEVENQVSFVKPEAAGTGNLADALRAYGEGKAPEGSIVKVKVTVANPQQAIQVLALPDTGRPANFDGAVGRFSINATVNHTTVEEGAVAYLDITVSGNGNLPVIGKPSIAWPTGVETFEDSIREDYNQFRSPEHWMKIFTVPFTVRQKGQKIIPSIRLVYFDPDSGHYRTATTDPIQLRVVASTGVARVQEAPSKFWGEQTDKYWLWLPAILVLGMVVLFIGQRIREARRRRLEEEQRIRAEQDDALRNSEQTAPRTYMALDVAGMRSAMDASDAPAFYGAMELALQQWCVGNLGIGTDAVRSSWEKAWNALGMPAEPREIMRSFMKKAESARYDPLLGSEGLTDEFAHIAAFADRLEKAIVSP
jgi:hypothetical protein